MSGLTRRQVLIATGALALAGGSYYGRFAFGDSFERHVAQQIDLDLGLTRKLLATMREQVGFDYDARASSFLAATRSPSKLVMTRGMRQEAIESFIGPLFGMSEGLVVPFDYVGLQSNGKYTPCKVLARP